MDLVTLAEALAHLKIDLLTDDGSPPVVIDERLPDIELKITASSEIVLGYIKRLESGWDAETAPRNVKVAVLMVLESLFDDSARGETIAALSGNDLKNPVVAILYRMRDPALA